MANIVSNLFPTPIKLKVNSGSYLVSMGTTKKRYTEQRDPSQLPMVHYGALVEKFIENELPRQFHGHTYSLVKITDDTLIAVCMDQ